MPNIVLDISFSIYPAVIPNETTSSNAIDATIKDLTLLVLSANLQYIIKYITPNTADG